MSQDKNWTGGTENWLGPKAPPVGSITVTLEQAVDLLIAQHGLPAVYAEVRSRPGFCGNCGCPLLDDQPHVPGGLGYCHG